MLDPPFFSFEKSQLGHYDMPQIEEISDEND